jgi:hypothetical protein
MRQATAMKENLATLVLFHRVAMRPDRKVLTMSSRLHKTIVSIALVAACATGAQAEGLHIGRAVGFAPQRGLLGDAGVAEHSFWTPAGDDANLPDLPEVGPSADRTRPTAPHLGYEPYQYTSPFDEKPYLGNYAFGLTVHFW